MSGQIDPRVPVTLLTGFLGSGKTTVLNHLLPQPELRDAAVIINELGEIGLDHLLVETTRENLRVLQSGCLCCTVRGDLVDTLLDLAVRRARGEIAAFARIIVETTGLADPAPVLHTLMADPDVMRSYRLDAVVTTVDAVNGWATLDRHAEAVQQAAVADHLLLTKCDLAAPTAVEALEQRLTALNAGASLQRVVDGNVTPGELLCNRWHEPMRWTAQVRPHAHGLHRHDHRIQAHCFRFTEPLQEAAFTYWLDLIASMRGEKLLRVKGLVQVAERPDQPLVVQGAQHVFHPPVRLPAWPSADRSTRLVFITRDLARSDIARTLEKFAGVRPAIPTAIA